LTVNLPPAPAPEAPPPAGPPIQTAGEQPPQPGLQPVRPLWIEFGSMQGQKPQPPRAVTNPWVKSADNTAPSEPLADMPASSRREKIQVGQAAPNNDPAAATVVKPLSAFPTEKSPASPVAADKPPLSEPVAKSPATSPAAKSKAASTAAAPKKAKSAPKAESSAKSSPASAEKKPATDSGSFPTQPPPSVAKSPAMQAVSLSKSEPAAPAPAAVQPQPFAGYHAAPAEHADVPRFSGMTPALAALRSLAQAKNRRIEERRAAGAARLPAPHMSATIPQAGQMPPAAPEDFGKLPEGSPFEAIQESGTVKLRVNRSTLLRTKVNIERTAMVDESVIEVVQYGARDVSIIGRKIGQTHVTFWFDDPAKPPVTYLVEVKPDTALTYQPQPKANTLATAAQASVQQQPPTPSVVPASSRRPAAAR
jgi:hypothetical protein